MMATRTDRGSTGSTSVYSENGDLVFERTFSAGREQVWKAFTDPNLVPRWWGPHGTSLTVEEMDVRPGGTWRFATVSADGEPMAFYGEYLEVTPPERIRWTFMFDVPGVGPQGGPETMTLEEIEPGVTRLRAVGHMGSEEIVEAALATGMVGGAIETYDRLEALLAELAA